MLQNISASQADGLLSEFPLGLTLAAAIRHAQIAEKAFRELPSELSLQHVQLLAIRVVALAQSDINDAFKPAYEAFKIAEEIGGEHAQAYALVARSIVNSTPEYSTERAEAAREILRISKLYSDPLLEPIGFYILLVAFLEAGEIRKLDAALADNYESEQAIWFHSLRAILDGDLTRAEELVEKLNSIARVRPGSDAASVRATHLGLIRWMQGRMDGAEDHFLAARRSYPDQIVWPASLVWLWIGQGRLAAAQSLFNTLPAIEDIPRDRYWLATLTVLAEVATQMGTVEFATQIRNKLLPFAGHLVPMGEGVAFWGTAARSLGLLEERLGLLNQARIHLELAVEVSARIGAQAWLAEAQIELAEFALRHNIGDIPAFDLLEQALATSESRGFPLLLLRAKQRPRIYVLGQFEVTGARGVRAEWTSRKARELLKMLVAARGVATSREVFMEVLWPGQSPATLANRFSVAVNTIRRALDPERQLPRQHHVVVEGDCLRLNLKHVDIDLERFLVMARSQDVPTRHAALQLYHGEAFADEPYADWAVSVRNHAHYVWDLVTREVHGAHN